MFIYIHFVKMFLNVFLPHQALTAFDRDSCGKVTVADFRRVLDLFCFILTEDQWKHVKSGLNIGADQCVDYNEFLSGFVNGEVSFSTVAFLKHLLFIKNVQLFQIQPLAFLIVFSLNLIKFILKNMKNV